jgi:hypothetical protein
LPDESWSIVAGRTGVAITDLQAANPQAMRANAWLLTNEVLQIPVMPQPEWPRAGVILYTVQPGDSWNSIAADFQISPTLLWAVNWHLRRPWGVLITGDEMIIPPGPQWPPQ